MTQICKCDDGEMPKLTLVYYSISQYKTINPLPSQSFTRFSNFELWVDTKLEEHPESKSWLVQETV